MKIKREDIILSSEQKRAIISVVNGKDTIVCLPTGHGKSIVFEITPWCHSLRADKSREDTVESEEITVVLVVSPLLALMNKQVDFQPCDLAVNCHRRRKNHRREDRSPTFLPAQKACKQRHGGKYCYLHRIRPV